MSTASTTFNTPPNGATGAPLSSGASPQSAAKPELGLFLDDVQDLLSRVTHIDDADIARVRSRVAKSLEDTRASVTAGARNVRDRASAMASSTDDYVSDRPWTFVGVAAVVGLALGFALGRR